jgi:hypothetical protein
VTRAGALEWRPAPFGRLGVQTVADFSHRVVIASTLVATQDAPPEPATGRAPVYVVGFGCVPVPASPRPNPAYQWTTT